MRVLIKNTYIYNPAAEAFFSGDILIGGDKIIAVGKVPLSADLTLDAGGALAVPGFVDIHTHGRDGFDFTTADEAGMKKMARGYLSAGTTTLLPTLASAPSVKALCDASDKINAVKANTGGANFAGIHLEGRYLNPEKRGAHAPEMLALHDITELTELVEHMKLPCHISSALELDSCGFAERALELGATLGLVHTCASYEQAVGYYEKYGVSFSHTWNAMLPLHHRGGGAVSAALVTDAYAELICDGIHIAPDVVRLTYKAKGADRLALVTDSMEATGMPDGQYSIAGKVCHVKSGIARTEEGALAGSTLDMKTAVENLVSFCGIPFSTALRCATLTPAEAVGIDGEVGSLEPGKRADMILCKINGKKLELDTLICGGQPFGGGSDD